MTSVRVTAAPVRLQCEWTFSPAFSRYSVPQYGHLPIAGGRDVDEDARVVAPERHLRIRAEDDARALQVRGESSTARAVASSVAIAVQTLVSHSAYLGLRPLTMSKNALWIFSVIGPREPAPSSMRSSSRIGVTSAAVPVKNASSQM